MAQTAKQKAAFRKMIAANKKWRAKQSKKGGKSKSKAKGKKKACKCQSHVTRKKFRGRIQKVRVTICPLGL